MRLRSLLFVPGDRPDQMLKACNADADALILDLEDSVAAERKPRARLDVAAFLEPSARSAALAGRATLMFVRLNPSASGLTDEDLDALAGSPPDGVVYPKAAGADSISDLGRLLQARGLESTRILPIATETPAAIFRLGDYASVAERLMGLTWGAEDLSAAVGAASAREPDGAFTAPYELARSLTLFAAHAAQVPAIETVYPAFRDLDGLARYARRGARDGFSGMMAIHPSQVPLINAAFTPSAEAVEHARRVVEAFSRQPGAGVVSIDGAMYDAPHLAQARRILAQAAAG